MSSSANSPLAAVGRKTGSAAKVAACRQRLLRLCLLGVSLTGVLASAASQPAAPAAPAATDALRAGERMYRDGILPDGRPMTAVVAGDIAIDGSMFACANCHQRSGLGSLEGPVIAWPVSGRELFVPRRRAGTWNPARQRRGPGAVERWSLPQHLEVGDWRPPYDEAALARVLRTGIDPAGRVLNRAMPRYELDDEHMALLIDYLKRLSDAPDPGAEGDILHFATVVTDGVPEEDKAAMLDVLRAHIDARNTQTRPFARRARAGPFYKTEKYGAYRRLALDVWELHGPPESWPRQLDEYYRRQPVFALLGGIADGSWAPIHRFCEDKRLPAIFPLTDRPVVSDSDWYTLYFSKGLYQEGEAAARFLARSAGFDAPGLRVVQVYRPGGAAADAARGFAETWRALGRGEVQAWPLQADQDPASTPWRTPASDPGPRVEMLWLDGADLAASLAQDTVQPPTVFAAWTLASDALAQIPDEVRARLFLTYPYSLPDDRSRRAMAIGQWLKARRIPPGDATVQGKMYFLGWMLSAAIDYLRSEFYRDYFLEAFDMMPDEDYAIPVYPRLSFGPGQRYAAKGCYITRLAPGDGARLVRASEWVVN